MEDLNNTPLNAWNLNFDIDRKRYNNRVGLLSGGKRFVHIVGTPERTELEILTTKAFNSLKPEIKAQYTPVNICQESSGTKQYYAKVEDVESTSRLLGRTWPPISGPGEPDGSSTSGSYVPEDPTSVASDSPPAMDEDPCPPTGAHATYPPRIPPSNRGAADPSGASAEGDPTNPIDYAYPVPPPTPGAGHSSPTTPAYAVPPPTIDAGDSPPITPAYAVPPPQIHQMLTSIAQPHAIAKWAELDDKMLANGFLGIVRAFNPFDHNGDFIIQRIFNPLLRRPSRQNVADFMLARNRDVATLWLTEYNHRVSPESPLRLSEPASD